MRPLLWKEMRELRMWVVGGALLMGATQWAAGSELHFYSADAYLALFLPLLLTATAIGLGAGQIARERHARTLDFLMVRPVGAGRIVGAKFLAGSVVLALLGAGMVGLVYSGPLPADVGVLALRQHVGFQGLALALLPRYWCLYALALFFSAFVDRAAKAAGTMVVVAITIVTVSLIMETVAPFAGFVYWLPFFENSFGLAVAARSASILWTTGLVCSGGALLLAAAAAGLLRRSAEQHAGNRGVAAITVGIVAIAVLSVHAASTRLPVVAPVGSVNANESTTAVLTSGDVVALVQDGRVLFYDFANPRAARQVAEVRSPLHSAEESVMASGTVFLLGEKKALPEDEVELVALRPGAAAEELSLGSARAHERISTPLVVGGYVYVPVARQDQQSLQVFDWAKRREIAALDLGPVAPTKFLLAPTACQRGRYVYVATPSALITVDTVEPARPVVASRLEYHPEERLLASIPGTLAWQGDRLFEVETVPEGLLAFDLKDPAHPRVHSGLTWHNGRDLAGSDSALYCPWQKGLLEFGGEREELRERRYFSGGRRVTTFAVGARYIFALAPGDREHATQLQAFAR